MQSKYLLAVGIGAVALALLFTATVMSDSMPDLVVTDIWQEGSYVYYQVMNVGDAEATGVHVDALFINGIKVDENSIDKNLLPGERYNGMFSFALGETPVDRTVRVETDYYGSVAEGNETNNALEAFWKKDTSPPVFVSPPIVESVTETSATIAWETDEGSDSLVEYGMWSGILDHGEESSDLVKLHSITLIGLEPHTTYRFRAQSADANGNIAQSAEKSFQTLALADEVVPTLVIGSIVGDLAGRVLIQPSLVSDDTGVEKVEFSIDGAPFFTAYSPPYALPLDTWLYPNGPHDLEAAVFDFAGNSMAEGQKVDISNVKDGTAPVVIISSPADDSYVQGIVVVKADLEDDVKLDSARFYVDGSYTEYKYLQGWDHYYVEFTLDVRQLAEGTKLTLAVEATDSTGNVGSDSVRVFVEEPEPEPTPPLPDLLVKEHRVERSGNTFTVTLVVENAGDGEAKNVRILDAMKGFQPISASGSNANFSANYDPAGRWACAYIDPAVDIPAGGSQTYTYSAVPVLLYPSPPTPAIGYFIEMYYNAPSGIELHKYLTLPVDKTAGGETIPKAHEEAVKACDYLIVTDPYRLFANYNPGYYSESIFSPSQSRLDVNALLSSMARLAFHKQGTLGYFDASSVQVLKNLIKPGGEWANRMGPDFTVPTLGYLLIVGENEIVPSLHTWGWNIKWSDGSTTTDVYYSDQCYADTDGNWGKPELNVGRIIGDKPSNMTHAIQTSLGVYLGSPGYSFDLSKATLLSGTGKGQDEMVNGVNSVRDTLLSKGLLVSVVHEKDYPFESWARSDFQAAAKGADAVYIHAHGTPDSSGPLYTGWLSNLDFDGSNPVVFTSSCLTGDYEAGDNYNFAEAFLDRGAGAYIGATQVSPTSVNTLAGKTFFGNILGTYAMGGWMRSFTLLEWMLSSTGTDYNNFWVVEYNVYGDPKFGVPPELGDMSVMSGPSLLGGEPLSSLDVIVPDYVVTEEGTLDRVEIPGGSLLLEVGSPQVPIYFTVVDYPEGVRIQDVVLGMKSNPEMGSGLNLPITTADYDPAVGGYGAGAGATDGWYPGEDFRWEAVINPDGTTTLVIAIYPFQYNPSTTRYSFCSGYPFEIYFTVSQVGITALSTDSEAYRQGDPVRIDMMLANEGAPQDVVVSTVVKRSEGGLDEAVYGFPLRTLKDFRTPAASFSEEWDTTGFEPGYYSAEITLEDADGQLLDRRVQLFKIGVSSIEIADFSAAPESFSLGGNVQVTMALRNTGSVAASGTAVVRVMDSGGQIVHEFTDAVADLPPSGEVTIENVWGTAGVEEGSYHIIGYVLYNDEISDVRTATVSSNAAPSLTIEAPAEGAVLQDGVTFIASAWDDSGVASVEFSIETPLGDAIPGFQDMPAAPGADGKWRLYFDTSLLPDGGYLLVAEARDAVGNPCTKEVHFSIGNWDATELLPASEVNKAGRTMPIKFSIRVDASVDPERPFVWNEELTVVIYVKGYPETVLQASTYGTGSTDYRIDAMDEKYITNFKTLKSPTMYVVEIRREGVTIGSFEFSTVK